MQEKIEEKENREEKKMREIAYFYNVWLKRKVRRKKIGEKLFSFGKLYDAICKFTPINL